MMVMIGYRAGDVLLLVPRCAFRASRWCHGFDWCGALQWLVGPRWLPDVLVD